MNGARPVRARLAPAAPWLLLALALALLGPATFELRDARFAGALAAPVPDLWLPTFGVDANTLLHVGAVNTGASLVYAALLFALVEAGLAGRRLEGFFRPLFRAGALFVVFWSFFGHLPLWDLLLSTLFPGRTQLLYPNATVVGLAAEHLELVLLSSVVTVSLGLLLGVLVTRPAFDDFLPLVSDLVNVGQTLPTLAVVALMVPLLGLGFWPAVVALVLYGVLPVVRNTVAGLQGVDAFMVDSAKGMGMTPAQIFWRIELPSATRVILAGVRTSVVIGVGVAALGAFAGAGGLGVPLAGGLNQTILPYVLEGALPAALLAILLDYVLGRLELVLTPRGLLLDGETGGG